MLNINQSNRKFDIPKLSVIKGRVGAFFGKRVRGSNYSAKEKENTGNYVNFMHFRGAWTKLTKMCQS
jgi:hypothetical protein